MSLSFLPNDIKNSIAHLNYNFLSELRLRRGHAVIIEYRGEYHYLGQSGISVGENDRIAVFDIENILNLATNGCIYAYTEQLKSGFITVGHGIRIGVAGEYVTENGLVKSIKNPTSLNIRVSHDIKNCSNYLFKTIFANGVESTLIFSKPGLGKTTMLRDIARNLTAKSLSNILVFDERGEISAMDGYGDGFELGSVDVVRSFNKLGAIKSAIRAMKPHVIITDELYGEDDLKAVKYASNCGIAVIASSHVTDRNILKNMPFKYFVELKSINGQPEIYDKSFNSYCNNRAHNDDWRVSVGE